METKKNNSLGSLIQDLDGQVLKDSEAARILGGASSQDTPEVGADFNVWCPVNKCNDGCPKE